MELRRATVEDASTFRQLLGRLHSHMATSINDPLISQNAESFFPAYDEWFDRSIRWNSAVVVLAQDADVIGFAAGDIQPTWLGYGEFQGSGVLSLIWVEPPYRRRGIAKLLVAAVEEWLREKGMPLIQIPYMVGTPGAAAFYSAAGYEDYMVVCRKRLM
jgi:GNAT superfamily N-acetyltransferase